MTLINFGLFRGNGERQVLLERHLDSIPRVGETVTIGGMPRIVGVVEHHAEANRVHVNLTPTPHDL